MEKGVRTTVMLTSQQNDVLRGLAEQHKVSVAWVIREAVDRLIASGASPQLPLDLDRPHQ